MNDTMIPSTRNTQSPRVWWLAIPLLTAAHQTCVKLLSLHLASIPFGVDWMIGAVTTPFTAGILICEIMNFALWMKILSTIDISRAAPLTAVSYLFVLAISRFVFGEELMPLQWIGSALILAGVVLISTSPSPKERA